jgi:DNA-binding response OmpR family regulator
MRFLVVEDAHDLANALVRVTVGTPRRKIAHHGEAPLIQTVIGRGGRLREVL